MRIQDAYDDWANTYDTDRNLTRDLDRTVTRKMLEGSRYDTIIEIGCGTGKNTLFFCDIARIVYALDFSPAMLRKARQKHHNRNVAFLLTNIEQTWPLRPAVADLIACNLVLEHVSDFSFIFSEARRTLAPGGQFFISELHPFRQYMGVVAAFDARGQQTMIPAFVHHVSEFLDSGKAAHMNLLKLDEWWHQADDPLKSPRLISFLFERPTGS